MRKVAYLLPFTQFLLKSLINTRFSKLSIALKRTLRNTSLYNSGSSDFTVIQVRPLLPAPWLKEEANASSFNHHESYHGRFSLSPWRKTAFRTETIKIILSFPEKPVLDPRRPHDEKRFFRSAFKFCISYKQSKKSLVWDHTSEFVL